MQDLKFIKECENCHHNISYDKQDIKKEREFIGYSIVYNEWGDGDSYRCTKLINTLEELVKELVYLTNYKSTSGFKYRVKDICGVAKNIETITCPNCKEKIVLKTLDNTYHSISILGKVDLKYLINY